MGFFLGQWCDVMHMHTVLIHHFPRTHQATSNTAASESEAPEQVFLRRDFCLCFCAWRRCALELYNCARVCVYVCKKCFTEKLAWMWELLRCSIFSLWILKWWKKCFSFIACCLWLPCFKRIACKMCKYFYFKQSTCRIKRGKLLTTTAGSLLCFCVGFVCFLLMSLLSGAVQAGWHGHWLSHYQRGAFWNHRLLCAICRDGHQRHGCAQQRNSISVCFSWWEAHSHLQFPLFKLVVSFIIFGVRCCRLSNHFLAGWPT